MRDRTQHFNLWNAITCPTRPCDLLPLSGCLLVSPAGLTFSRARAQSDAEAVTRLEGAIAALEAFLSP